MNEITVTNELEIRVERVFDASRAHVISVLTDLQVIPSGVATAHFQLPPWARESSPNRLGP